MATDDRHTRSAFAWNASAWLGTTLGSTMWLFLLGGLFLLRRDALPGGICIASFALLNAWGVYLWRSRRRLSAYAGLQRFFAALSVVVPFIFVVVSYFRVEDDPSSGALLSTFGLDPTCLPFWVIVIGPAAMLYCSLREEWARRGQ